MQGGFIEYQKIIRRQTITFFHGDEQSSKLTVTSGQSYKCYILIF